MLVANTTRSRAHVSSQPSSGTAFPSSHSSPAAITPSPQTGAISVVAPLPEPPVDPVSSVVVCPSDPDPPVIVDPPELVLSPVDASPLDPAIVVLELSPVVELSESFHGYRHPADSESNTRPSVHAMWGPYHRELRPDERPARDSPGQPALATPPRSPRHRS